MEIDRGNLDVDVYFITPNYSLLSEKENEPKFLNQLNEQGVLSVETYSNKILNYTALDQVITNKLGRIRKTIGIFDPNLKYQPDSFSVLSWSIFKFSSLSWCSCKGF